MEKKNKPVAPLGEWVKNRIIKLITFFTCVVLIFANLFIFSFSPYGIGYKYYENTVQIGVTQQEDLMDTTINDYIAELGENGYYIFSTEWNTDIIYKQSIIRRSEINDEEIKKTIKDSLIVSVLTTKLLIENDNDDVYYFKSEEECKKFINNLKEYKDDIVTTTNDEIIEVNKITAETVLQDKIEVYRLDREARDREAAEAAARELERQRQIESQAISSRSGSSRVSYSGSCAHPLDSYTYISSYFGYRSRGFHTGVDFATPSGTEVHAWKAGTVIRASWCGGYGNYIQIQHDDGTISCYAHLNGYACSVGEYVDCHETIGYSGSTGNSTRSALTFWN